MSEKMPAGPFAQPINPMQQQQELTQKFHTEIRLKESQMILAIFNGPEGDVLLDLWDDIYIRQAVAIPSPGGELNAFQTAKREGRNEFIRLIRAIINKARNANGGNNTGGTS